MLQEMYKTVYDIKKLKICIRVQSFIRLLKFKKYADS